MNPFRELIRNSQMMMRNYLKVKDTPRKEFTQEWLKNEKCGLKGAKSTVRRFVSRLRKKPKECFEL